MTRFLHRSACLVGLCMLALTIGCGSSSKKKVTCDGGPCGDAGRDVSGDVKKDGGGTDGVMQPDVARADTGLLSDTNPAVLPDGAVADTNVADDAPTTTTDVQPALLDTGVATDTSGTTTDTRPADTRTTDTLVSNPDTRPLDTKLADTATISPDTGLDTPVNVDAAADAPADASVVDAALNADAGDAGESDADTDAS